MNGGCPAGQPCRQCSYLRPRAWPRRWATARTVAEVRVTVRRGSVRHLAMPEPLPRSGMDRAAHSRLKVHHETKPPHNNTADAARAPGFASRPVAWADRCHRQTRTGTRIECVCARTSGVKTASRAHGQGPQGQLTAPDDPGRAPIFTGQPAPSGKCSLTAISGRRRRSVQLALGAPVPPMACFDAINAIEFNALLVLRYEA